MKKKKQDTKTTTWKTSKQLAWIFSALLALLLPNVAWGCGPGNALKFGGVDDYVALSDTGAGVGAGLLGNCSDLSEFTIELWYQYFGGVGGPLVGKHSNIDFRGGYTLKVNSPSHEVQALVAGSDNIWVTVTGPVLEATGRGYHLAMVWDGAFLRLFVDGTLADETELTDPILDGLVDAWLGSSQFYGGYSTGIMDEIRFWDHARSEAEINAHMRTPLYDGDIDGLTAYYRADASEGAVLTDHSGNDYHGDLNNFADTTDCWQTSAVWPECFTDIGAGLPGAGSEADHFATFADYDNDNDLDVIFLDSLDRKVYVYDYDAATQSFSENTGSGLQVAAPGAISWGDYDNDGDLDALIISSDQTSSTRVYRNKGDRTFEVAVELDDTMKGDRGDGAWADYDGDGDLDILLTGHTGSEKISKVLRNNGDNTFTDIEAGLEKVDGSSVAWGDYDNDGDPDILLAGYDSDGAPVSRVYRNNGDHTFTDIKAGLPGALYPSVAWGDYDSDGDLDILFTGMDKESLTFSRIYRNDNAVFTDIEAGLQPVIGGCVAWGDYDNDGDLDILLAGRDTVESVSLAAVYRNNNNDHTFTDMEVKIEPLSNGYMSCSWGDFDRDNDLDFLLVTRDGSYVYENTGSDVPRNQAPAPPVNPHMAAVGSDIVLHWQDAADSETPAALLSYNAYLGTSPTTVDILSPMANPSTGARLLPAMGNSGFNRFCRIRGLDQNTTYYGAVQSVDTGFAASTFAAEIGLKINDCPKVSTRAEHYGIAMANFGGEVLVAGASALSERGVVWSSLPYPTLNSNDGKYVDPEAVIGSFVSAVSGLTQGASYYVRAYAINGHGATYGSQKEYQHMLPPGNALDFDGISGYGRTVRTTDLETFTIEAMVYPRSLPGTSQRYLTLGSDTIILAYDGAAGSGQLLFSAMIDGVAQEIRSDNDTITPDNWRHIAASWDGSDMRLFVNGREQGTLAVTGALDPQDNSLQLGDATEPLDGFIDEVRIWNHARTGAQLRSDMIRQLNRDQTGLLHYYRFNETGNADTAVDSSGVADLLLTDMDTAACWQPSTAWNSWHGELSQDWHTQGNWSLNRTPGTDENVGLIANAANLPVLSVDAQCRHLRIEEDMELSINAGVALTISGNLYSFTAPAGDGTLRLASGSMPHYLAGVFIDLDIDDSQGALLDNDTTLSGSLNMVQGHLDLNSHILTLGENALLNESSGNTVTGSAPGGYIETTRTFTPGSLSSGQDIAGLGAEISSDAGLGLTTIRRGHDPQTNGEMLGLTRWFEIEPANNAGLNADLVFHYDYFELDPACSDATLQLYRSDDQGISWVDQGGAAAAEAISLNSIDGFSRWTAFGDHRFTDTGIEIQGKANSDAPAVSCAALGDYDNDGDLDILAVDYNDSRLRLYRNEAGAFSEIQDIGLPLMEFDSVHWGDYDNDGDLDILCDGSSSYLDPGSKIWIFRNSNGVFTQIDPGLPKGSWSFSPPMPVWGDYDSDGDLDILAPGISAIFRNDNGCFIDIKANLPDFDMYNTGVWGDYDNDGDLDFIISGDTESSDEITRVYRNDQGSFIDIQAGLPGIRKAALAWGDYDNDGDLDILISGSAQGGAIRSTRVYRNDQGNFIDIQAGLPGNYRTSVAWGDYDNDGDLDILFNSDIMISVYRNDDGLFTDIGAELPILENSMVAWGDYDNDGDLDLFNLGDRDEKNYIYENHSLAPGSQRLAPNSNTPPEPVTGLRVVSAPDDSTVILEWDPTTDTQTPAPGLTYNLRIGTGTTGADNDVATMPPMAELDDGYRLLPHQGNTFHTTRHTITGLDPDTTYYGSVQAVDTSFAGSGFGAEYIFSRADSPVAATSVVTMTDSTTALMGGEIVSEGNFTVTERGLVWDSEPEPTLEASSGRYVDSGAGVGSFSITVPGLTRGQVYYVRAYGIYGGSVTYGRQRMSPPVPTPGNALAFDGQDDYVEVADNNHLDLVATYTIEAWIRPDGFSLLGGIVSKSHTPDANGYTLRLSGSGNYRGLNFDGLETADNLLTAGKWVHVAAVNDNGTRTLYINGIAQTLTGTPHIIAVNTDPLRIGCDYASHYFNGQIEDVRVWNTVRTEYSIRMYMSRVLYGSESGLAAYYRFDHQPGDDVSTDSGPNGLDGSPVDMEDSAWVTSKAPLGDSSSNLYTSNWGGISKVITHSDGDFFRVETVTGTPDGIQLYRIDGPPNVTSPPSGWNRISDQRAWGVFVINGTAPTYRVLHGYDGHPDPDYEYLSGLASRDDSADTSWSDIDAALDVGNDWLIKEDRTTAQFILGWRNDADTDSDDISDFWEDYHFGDLTTATATSDWDKDRYSDKQEYLNERNGETDPLGNPYDPKTENAPNGTGYKKPFNILLMIVPIISAGQAP